MPPLFSDHGVASRRILPLLLCCNLALLLFFLTFDYQLIFHSDAAVKNLLAQEIYETGRFFPRDWNYVNKDLWVFGTQAFIVPLLAFLPNGIGVHILSDCLSAVLIIWSAWLFTALLDVSRAARLAGLLVITAGISLIMAEHVFGQAAYGTLFYLASFLLYCYWRQLHATGRDYWWWSLGSMLVSLQVFWTNPQRAAVFYLLPLAAAAFALKLNELRQQRAHLPVKRLRHWRSFGLFVLAGVLGVLLNGYTMRHVHNAPGLTELAWLDFDGMRRQLAAVIQGLLILFDALPRLGTDVVHPAGAYRILRLLTGLAMLYLLPVAMLRILGPKHPGRLFCAAFTAAALCLNLIMMLTTTVADAGSPDGAIRYLVPTVLNMLMILAALSVDGLHLGLKERVAGLAVVAVLSLSAAPTYLFPYYLHFAGLPPSLKLPTDPMRLVHFLHEQNLKYGYASFWQAGKFTVLSSHTIKIRQVNFEQGVPVPMRVLASNRWFEPAAWEGETFLLLNDAELATVDRAYLARHLGEPVRTLRFETWNILVYGSNMATLPMWDEMLRSPVSYPINDKTPHQIGALRGGALAAGPGAEGALYYGPFRKLAPGRYRVSFDVEAKGEAEAGFGHVDVSSSAGQAVHGKTPIAQAGRQRLEVDFDTAEPLKLVEFRAFSNGKGELVLHGIDAVRLQ
ncbi:hypothetical protein [Massilia endophytica]|uniref:hypothetical protein n=1 Tax=Massilia endophytica TaxID=2899220 RepID=UPI001E51D93E|nr:hypothetical protein [Massilia endophytica]UGQ45485.1 hypothetical protein LSQ66_17070 [Massilia endophytica]